MSYAVDEQKRLSDARSDLARQLELSIGVSPIILNENTYEHRPILNCQENIGVQAPRTYLPWRSASGAGTARWITRELAVDQSVDRLAAMRNTREKLRSARMQVERASAGVLVRNNGLDAPVNLRLLICMNKQVRHRRR